MVVKVEHGDDEDMYIPNVGGEPTRRDQTKTRSSSPLSRYISQTALQCTQNFGKLKKKRVVYTIHGHNGQL